MEPRISILTLRVDDLEAATRYYVDELGWQPLLAVPGEVTFLPVGHGVVLGLFDARGFDADAGRPLAAPLTLAHNVGSEAEVDAVTDEMVAAGGTLVRAPARASWGGYHGFVEDPAGYCWEIAHNPAWRVAPDGTVAIGPVEA
jgi:catechol 2,3-dioxygenase-like lactoylglutathione lyase family enzyme